MRNYYVSFGQNHQHEWNGLVLDKDCLLLMQGESWLVVREAVMKLFGRKWSNIYQEAELQGMLSYYPRGVVNAKV